CSFLCYFFFFFLRFRLQPISTLFPYTTLFRSCRWAGSWSRCWHSSSLCRSICNYICIRKSISMDPSDYSTTHLFLRVLSPLVFLDRKSTRLNSSHEWISYAVFCLKKKKY